MGARVGEARAVSWLQRPSKAWRAWRQAAAALEQAQANWQQLQQERARYAGVFFVLVTVADETGSFSLRREVEFLGPEARLLREEKEEARRAHR